MRRIKRTIAILIAFFLVLIYPASAFAAQENTILISNESVNGYSSESTGIYEINRSKYVLDKTAGNNPVDVVKPFSVAANRNRLLKSGQLSTQSVRADVKADTQKRTFSAWNLATGGYDKINTELAYSGTFADVWVNDNQITAEQANTLGQEFDRKIYNTDVSNFGNLANGIGNGKINIVCYNIKSDNSGDGAYVAGYFNPNDLTSGTTSDPSNRSEILYIDAHPLMDTATGSIDVTQAFSTLAHELQHLISFNQRVLVNKGFPFDTWIDEGLSMAAEQLYLGRPLNDRIDYYNVDLFDSIRSGQSLLNWQFYGDSLANYSLSYLFVQYLRAQVNPADRTDVFKQLIGDPHSDYQAVQDVIHKDISSRLSFSQFMTDFRIALYYNNTSGLYGFGDNLGHSSLNRNTASGQIPQLSGGGAVFVPAATKIRQSSNSYLQYINLTPGGPVPLFSEPLSTRQISVANNTGHYDRIYVKGLQKGDIIKAYSSSHHELKQQTSGGGSTTLYIRQLGSRSGFVYVSVTHANTRESRWTRGYFSGEITGTLRRNQIHIYNYRNRYDQVRVYGISRGDYIRVYNSRGRRIAGKYASGHSVILYIRQLGRGAGHIYVTDVHYHMREGYKRYAGYSRE